MRRRICCEANTERYIGELNMEEKYKEILKLHAYCEKIGVHAELEALFDGYAIQFQNGGGVIQHGYSYGNDCGCVEPAIGCNLDYSAVPLETAMSLIRRHKNKLNCTGKAGLLWQKNG